MNNVERAEQAENEIDALAKELSRAVASLTRNKGLNYWQALPSPSKVLNDGTNDRHLLDQTASG
jgi:hypothetical protein